MLLHYGFELEQPNFSTLNDRETWDEDVEDDEENTEVEPQEKRQKLRSAIDSAIGRLLNNPVEARRVYNLMWLACDNDLM